MGLAASSPFVPVLQRQDCGSKWRRSAVPGLFAAMSISYKIQKFPFPFLQRHLHCANLIVVPRVRVRSPAHPSNPVQESHPNTGFRVPCRRACMILNFGSSPKINAPYMPSSWAAKGPLSNAHMDPHTPGASRNGAHSSRFSPSRTACVSI